jgi:hypothetical protein
MQGFIKYFWEKIILTIPMCFFAFSQSQIDVMYGIVIIVILDTILGMWVAIKYKIFSSHFLSRVFNKIGTYGIAMASVWVLAALEPEFFGWVFRWVGIFIIFTELFSNFEKLALLGFRIPGRILGRLNSQFYRFINEEDGARDATAVNILKNRIEEKCK